MGVVSAAGGWGGEITLIYIHIIQLPPENCPNLITIISFYKTSLHTLQKRIIPHRFSNSYLGIAHIYLCLLFQALYLTHSSYIIIAENFCLRNANKKKKSFSEIFSMHDEERSAHGNRKRETKMKMRGAGRMKMRKGNDVDEIHLFKHIKKRKNV